MKEDKDPKDITDFLGDNKDLTSAFPSQVSYATKKRSFQTTAVLLIIILLFLGIGGVLGWRYFTKDTKRSVNVNPNPSSTLNPSPVPTRTLDRSRWPIEVLNGSLVSGEAKRVAEALTDLGYTIVKIGNADKNNYTQNQLFVREGKREEIDLLLADLKSDFNIASVSGELKEGTASARLIIGKE